MQIIVFTQKTTKLVLHSGPYILDTNQIVELEGIYSVTADMNFYKACDAEGKIKLRVPMNRTNVIYI
jgi:hypothetical protein